MPERIEVSYPSRWVEHSKLTAKERREINRHVVAWMGKHTPSSPDVLQDLSDMDPGNGAAFPFPKADYQQAITIAKYFYYWVSWDDTNIETGTSKELEFLEKSIAGEPFTEKELAEGAGDNPYLTAWRLIGDEFSTLGMSSQWRKHLGSFMQWWARHAMRQTRICQALDSYQDFTEALKLRTKTAGGGGDVIGAEMTAGFEVPDELYYSREHQDLLHQAGKIIAISNDVASFGRELAEGLQGVNLLWLHYIFYKTRDLRESLSAVLEIHDRAVENFDKIASDILTHCAPAYAESLARVFDHYRYVASGFTRWHIEAPRYRNYVQSGEHPFEFFMTER